MTTYLARRALGSIPLILGIATIVFFVINLAPGDPVMLRSAPNVSPEALDRMRENLGLDRPVAVRYVRWLAALARGDLGVSFSHNQPVTAVLLEALPNTLILAIASLVLAFGFGVLAGVLQAVKQHGPVDVMLSVVGLFFYSMPSFWLALMLILVFSLYARNVWGWPLYFPASGMYSVDHETMSWAGRVWDRVLHLTLPTVSLTLVLAAGVARFARGSVLEVIRQDYIRTARAKGLPERTVILRHALRNGLMPVVTLLGLYLPFLFSGAVFIEMIFAWPGMGKLVFDSITQRDYPVIMGASFLFAVIVVVGNLIADVLYALVDPRVRYD